MHIACQLEFSGHPNSASKNSWSSSLTSCCTSTAGAYANGGNDVEALRDCFPRKRRLLRGGCSAGVGSGREEVVRTCGAMVSSSSVSKRGFFGLAASLAFLTRSISTLLSVVKLAWLVYPRSGNVLRVVDDCGVSAWGGSRGFSGACNCASRSVAGGHRGRCFWRLFEAFAS